MERGSGWCFSGVCVCGPFPRSDALEEIGVVPLRVAAFCAVMLCVLVRGKNSVGAPSVRVSLV